MRKEWKKMDESMNNYLENYSNIGKENVSSLKRQTLNL